MKELLQKINIKRLLQYGLYMLLALILQNTVFTQIRPLGVCPLILPCLAVAVGMFEGATFGAVFSLILGIFADMAFVENTVLFTVLFPLISFTTGAVSRFYINRRFFAYMGVSLIALLVTGAVQALLTFAGDSWSFALVRTALLQTLWSLPTAVLAYFPPAEWIK